MTESGIPDWLSENYKKLLRPYPETKPVAVKSELRLERVPSVASRIGIAKSTLYRWVAQGRFPAPVYIGPHTVAWDSRVVDGWIESALAGNVPGGFDGRG